MKKDMLFNRGCEHRKKKIFLHSLSFHIPHEAVDKMSKAGVNIGCDVPDVVLQIGIAVLQGHLYLADGIQGGGVIPVELLADVRQGQIGQLADQIHGNLPGFGRTLVFLGSTKERFFHIVEFADLADNQGRRGNGAALGLEHIVNGPGDVGKIQRHIV